MIEELVEIELKKILGPSETGAAVLLGNSDKTFVVFIGATEAEALTRALRQERLARPMTHELIDSLFLGFGIKIKCLNICSILKGLSLQCSLTVRVLRSYPHHDIPLPIFPICLAWLDQTSGVDPYKNST